MTDRAREESFREELERLRHGAELGSPPEALEQLIVERLQTEGLIETDGAATHPLLWLGRVAVVVVVGGLLVLVGFLFGRAGSLSLASEEGAVGSYMLLLRGGQAPASDEALRSSVSRMTSWVGELRSQGVLVTGERLVEAGWMIEQPGGEGRPFSGRTSDLQLAGDQGIAGFFRVDGVSDDGAIELAASCPFLLGGGSVELRRIDRGGRSRE